jgi:hypothetical protein
VTVITYWTHLHPDIFPKERENTLSVDIEQKDALDDPGYNEINVGGKSILKARNSVGP